MGTIAVVEVPVRDLPLAETVERVADCYAELERTVAADIESSVRAWIEGSDQREVRAALDADPSVIEAVEVTEENGATLYDVSLDPDHASARRIVCDHDGAMLEACTEGESWTIHIRFPGREHLSDATDAFEREGIELRVVRIHDLKETHRSALGLTESQLEALQTALESGYYEVPREAGLKDIADELGESHQSLSEKLRRAHQTVVSSNVIDGVGPEQGRST